MRRMVGGLALVGAVLLFLACIGVMIVLRWQKKQSEPSSAIFSIEVQNK